MQLTLLICVVLAAATAEDCVLSEWGDWTEWTSLDCNEKPSGAAPFDIKDLQRHAPSVQEEGRVICQNGAAGPYACGNVDQMGVFDINDICGQNQCGHPNALLGKDVYGWSAPDPTDPDTTVDWAIMACNWGTSFVRMTGDFEFFNADVVAWMEGEGGVEAGNRDVVVIGDYAYVSANVTGHGIQIINLNVIAALQPPFYPDGPLNIVTPTAMYNGVGIVNNLVTSPSTEPPVLYAAGAEGGITACGGGMLALDMTDPTNPGFLGCYSSSGEINDATCDTYDGPDGDYNINGTTTEICYAFNGANMVVIDADDKANMQLVSSTDYFGRTYASQGVVERRDIMLISGDTGDELSWLGGQDRRTRSMVWDIVDLDAPFVDSFYTAEFEAIDSKHLIDNDWVYLANYEAGLRVLRIDQTTETLTELGYFDMYNDNNDDTVYFYGANGAYLGFLNTFDDGIIPVSTVDQGLFVVRADFAYAEQLAKEGQKESKRYRYRTVLSADRPDSCPNTVDVQTKTVHITCDQ